MEEFESQYNKEHDIWIINSKESNSRIDSSSSQYLEKQLFDLINKKRLNIILDLKNPSHISESALKVILKVLKELLRLDGSFVLCGMKEYIIKNRDDKVHYHGFMPICDTIDEAIETTVSILKKKKSWFKRLFFPRR